MCSFCIACLNVNGIASFAAAFPFRAKLLLVADHKMRESCNLNSYLKAFFIKVGFSTVFGIEEGLITSKAHVAMFATKKTINKKNKIFIV